jgi:phosphonate ABC transporter permease subunit PhnE
MAAPDRLLKSTNRNSAVKAFSIVVPGSGQFFLGHRWKGIVILVVTAILAFVVNWALTNHKIGQVTIGGLTTSWLGLPFILFWVWNVLDSYASSSAQLSGERASPSSNVLVGVLFAAIILYVVAWNVTNVKLDRLVKRFNDARLVMTDLVNPEIFVYGSPDDEKVCSWNCLIDYTRARMAGRKPANSIRVSSNVYDIFGQVKKNAAPGWMTSLGLAQKGQQVSTFVAGKMIETIAIGLMATLFSTILAFPLSFLAAHNIMSRVPVVGPAIYYVMRTFLNVVRAVDTVVWGLIVIVWVGQGPFAGVLALTIHSIAALGKLFSEEIEHIDAGPVEALTATGANLLQTIRYAVVPQITPSFLAYTLLRWDINMRSATVIGFVAGGGIGFFVVETIRAGGYQQYATALWAVAVVIILVDLISAKWRENILKDQPRETAAQRSPSRRLRQVAYILIGLALFIYCWNVSEISIASMFEKAPTFQRLVTDFLRVDLTNDVLDVVVQQILITIFQALLATTLGALLALPFSFLAAKNLTGKNRVLIWLYYITRAIFNILRSIEALLYVAIFVFWVGIGPFAGMLALAITTFALIGKLFSEAIENIENGPIEAVTATGANPLQVINYAVLPQIVPPFVSYLIYQWDINIRMATIIGFAGGGGIGLTLSTFFGSLQYHKAGTVVAFIVVVVALMDFTSAKLREQLV